MTPFGPARIYLDHAATTPLLPQVAAAMEPWLRQKFGNPSSLHAEGRRAKDAIDQAREIVSSALGCLFAEVVFTSSGTEAANLAIVGAALGNEDSRRQRILFGAVEHHCVLHLAPFLARLGYLVELIPVDRIGRVQVAVLEEMLGDDVLLVSVMAANNELGTLQPVYDVGRLAHGAGALFHCDMVQTFLSSSELETRNSELNALPSNVSIDSSRNPHPPATSASNPSNAPPLDSVGLPLPGTNIRARGDGAHISSFAKATADSSAQGEGGPELVTISAHKINGPKGVGALYVRAGTRIKPVLYGGGQEREMRAGTENVAGIVGFGEAVRRVPSLPDGRRGARDRFLAGLDIPDLALSVPNLQDILPGHAHLRIPGVQAETMLILLDRMGVSASSGAACSSGSIEPSHVLQACGYSEGDAKEGLRFTFGRETTVEDATEAAKRFNEAAAKLGSGKLKP